MCGLVGRMLCELVKCWLEGWDDMWVEGMLDGLKGCWVGCWDVGWVGEMLVRLEGGCVV